jgi:ABC-type uncharacterized transport system substrate-binding protein
MLCMAAGGAKAQEIMLVLSSKAAPYVKAAAACQEKLASEGIGSELVQFSELGQSHLEDQIKVVITFGGRASATMAQELPETTWLYYSMTPHPSRYGLTSRPNTAGISSDTSLSEQLGVIQSSKKNVSKIGVLFRSSVPNSASILNSLQQEMPANIELVSVDLDSSDTVSRSIKGLLSQDVDIVWTVPDTAVYNTAVIKALLLESLRSNTPVFGFSHALVKAGATLGVGIDPSEQGNALARLVSKEAIDIHLSATSTIAINTVASERIGLKFTREILNLAEVVYDGE